MSFYGLIKDDFFGIGMGFLGVVDRISKIVIGVFNLNWVDI